MSSTRMHFTFPFMEKPVQAGTDNDRVHIKNHRSLFLPVTHAVTESDWTSQENQV
jgi:hypothetical protein